MKKEQLRSLDTLNKNSLTYSHLKVAIPAVIVKWCGDNGNEIDRVVNEFIDFDLFVYLRIRDQLSFTVKNKVILQVEVGEYLVILSPPAKDRNMLLKLTEEQLNNITS